MNDRRTPLSLRTLLLFLSLTTGAFAGVGEVVSIPFQEDFEAPLGPAWTVSGTGTFRTELTTSNAPHGGAQHLQMDSTTNQSNARNELTITVDLTGQQGVELSFFAKEFGDEVSPSPPSPFSGGADFDGVAVSSDGNNWYTIFEFPAGFPVYTQFIIDLDAAIATHGLTYNNTFRIRFNQFDNSQIATDGIAIDDVSIGLAFVAGVASLPFLEDFEAPLSDHWSVSGAGPSQAGLSPDDGPQEGAQHFVMDTTGDGGSARNELTLTIDMEGQTNMTLEFWAKEFDDESQPPPVAPFVDGSDNSNYDGVAISTAGILWYSIFSYPDSFPDYTEFKLDLDSAIAALGLSYNDSFLIRFTQFDNMPVPSDGIAIDNIRIYSDLNPEIVLEHPPGISMVDGSSEVKFGNVKLGSSTTRDITVHNIGTADLTSFSITIDGVNSEDFVIWVAPTPVVPPGQNTTLTVQFVPSDVGVRTAMLHFASNDADESPLDFDLSGTGVSGAGHSLTLPAEPEQGHHLNVPLRAQPRTIQYIYDESLLTSLPPGSVLTGMAFRINGGGASWPAEDLTWPDFDVQFSASNHGAGQLNNVFSENIADDAVTVRSGTLTVLNREYPAGATPNELGPQIAFTTPYTYNGGDLLITIRHSGNGLSHGLLDAASDVPGVHQGIWSDTSDAYTAVSTTAGGSSPVTHLRFTPPPGYLYNLWNTAMFTPAQLGDPAISGALADPEKDGVRNLFEYLFDLDPHGYDATPWQLTTETVGADDFLKLSFSIPELFADDANLLVEQSSSLDPAGQWTILASKEGTTAWISSNESVITQAPAAGGRIAITVRSPSPINNPDPEAYLRLRVVIP
ncbi:MAG: choice-of-anchor D domain-containing protein [Roseibacillus sp.]